MITDSPSASMDPHEMVSTLGSAPNGRLAVGLCGRGRTEPKPRPSYGPPMISTASAKSPDACGSPQGSPGAYRHRTIH